MRARSRHPQLVAAACRIYDVAIRLYPAGFRHEYARELALTFRNRVEDVVDDDMAGWIPFVVHIAIDWARTCGTSWIESRREPSASVLGLGDGRAPAGCLDRTTVDVSLVFAVAGVVMAVAGWYWYLVILPVLVHWPVH